MSKLRQPYQGDATIFCRSRDLHATAIWEFERKRPAALCCCGSHALRSWGDQVYIRFIGYRLQNDQPGDRGVKKNELLLGRIRRPGAGRKAQVVQGNELSSGFEQIMENYRAGNPMNAQVRFTYLCVREIHEKLQSIGQSVSTYVVCLLLKVHGYGKRKMQKKGTACSVEGRNEQFGHIAQLIQEYKAEGQPVVSMDSKKKELLGGPLFRAGKVYCQQGLKCQDHDFPSLAHGKVTPHGVLDLTLNQGVIHLGQGADTPEFACDCLHDWWRRYGMTQYPKAHSLLVLCDAGGSNNCSYYTFKEQLQNLSTHIGIIIRVAHYPSYCSKYNPIDHRLFPHVTRALQGVMLDSVDTVAKLINERASTKTGLNVFTHVLDKTYLAGKKVADDFKTNMKKNKNIQFDKVLPQWNYWACPNL
ncbi:MAG: ISAzo13 family transposase [Lewinellaceae bacterium]|nr:ISAzo13 family transposase [Lewinellaceae bacterium]MCB9285065.1 ISAzo13 family transposase [Lewinellaceae bacterium]